MKKRKIIQINCVYPSGSTGRLVDEIHRDLLRRGIDARVIYGRGPGRKGPGILRLCPEVYGKVNALLARIRGIPCGGCLLSTWRLIGILKREAPDVVHLHCINGNFVNLPHQISWLKKHRIPTVLTLHAEFWYTGGCGHALDCGGWRTGCGHCPRLRQETGSLFFDGTSVSYRRMKTAFRGFEQDLTVVSVSDWLRRRAEGSPILKDMSHETIQNGVDLRVFFYRPGRKAAGGRVIFHATPLFSDDPVHLKGGWYVLELARRIPDAAFLVAGKSNVRGEVPPNVTLLGEIRDPAKLAEHYSGADLTLLTSKRETFSMVCAESLCCGTPVVGFRAGAPEEICLPAYSAFVPPGDLDALEAQVRCWLERSWDKASVSRAAAQRYCTEKMLDAYWELYRRAFP